MEFQFTSLCSAKIIQEMSAEFKLNETFQAHPYISDVLINMVYFCFVLFCDKMLKNQRWLKHIVQKMKRQPVYTCGHQVTWQQSRSWLEVTGWGDFYLIWNQTKRHSWPPLPSSLYLPPPSGVFITKGDVGVGTIVGSAVFNILVIIGLSGIFAGQVWKKKISISPAAVTEIEHLHL